MDEVGTVALRDDDELRRLHGRLVERAAADGLLDVAYRTVDSPVGPLLLARTPAGVVRVAFAVQGHDAALQELSDRVSPRVLEAPSALDDVARELDEYFAGTRRTFDVPVDLRLLDGFRRSVVEHLRDVAYGRTASYAQMAAAAGSPRAVRAVGTACALNPVPLVLPCHRVVRSDGSPGQYAGGASAKRTLLALEAGAIGA
ncbi:methylated-DNA--[protein]-cysteine S-methyltransferase [Cellulomonas fimi]|uniref:Methylated-DNA--protein-cysteine methyltransferase n=1 Tax=Cellulomonas fimi (strain ATCC 484 / DSM 20113 / JCM 1341 / CCUG 24087 / LMG 16345 / NBRC 15513 / NCIMB 8980 / NCTC 7547 / NRS-133) TaxID=590998 RepID=F4GZJ5_CELFA|nr:methylated-DNA--[protein]-cysteine S-methyltransferase [Cellulomonas fimi]AEE46039.1 methylated-DNA/protein-cysteine methyltransferase [Cellulomonas fimi ATCC 484]NNH06891.1 methylated-DNA--[protein]-cysteine S-methyltransferase [Cellulomonas fimi]VEH31390.1 Methylated-DNA--protein-cysteine methyltransferase, constitutive [Cellulomonas fimi]